jgi:hypothetical protein
MSDKRKRSITIDPVKNGYCVTAHFHWKPSEKEPGRSAEARYVARSERELKILISQILAAPFVVVGDQEA